MDVKSALTDVMHSFSTFWASSCLTSWQSIMPKESTFLILIGVVCCLRCRWQACCASRVTAFRELRARSETAVTGQYAALLACYLGLASE